MLPRVAGLVADEGGCTYYRLILPLSVAKLKGLPVRCVKPGSEVDEVGESLEWADIIYLPRLTDDRWLEIAAVAKRDGKKIAVDFDDNIFEVSPFSPHYKECGIEDVTVETATGEIVELWKDGRDYDRKKNIKVLDNARRGLETADIVTTTTDILADVYREFNDNVVAIPNCIDTSIWKRLPLLPHDGIRVGWAGGSSHFHDWAILEEVMATVMERYPQVTLVIMGHLFRGAMKKIPSNRVEHHSWVHAFAYPYKFASLDLDFGVIPLEDNVFNRCKSNIKWVECGSLQIPSVTSYMSPYKESATEDNGIFIKDNKVAAWIEGISMMIEDAELRKKMGEAAYDTVMKDFDMFTQYQRWIDAYEDCWNSTKRVAEGEAKVEEALAGCS